MVLRGAPATEIDSGVRVLYWLVNRMGSLVPGGVSPGFAARCEIQPTRARLFRIMKLISIVALTALSLSRPPLVSPTSPECAVLSAAESAVVLGDARFIASTSYGAGLRRQHNIPLTPEESISFLSDASSCDAATNSYRKFRVKSSRPDVLIPTVIIRLGTNSTYLATALVAVGGVKEYVVLDSAFSVRSTVRLGPGELEVRK